MPSMFLFILSLVLFVIVNQLDPGYIVKHPGNSLIKLYDEHHCDSICPFCQIKRSSKTRHCQYCERCVLDYDHHCPWIRNCVGAGNFKIFIVFLVICCVDLAYTSILGLLDFLEKLNNQYRIVEVKSYHKEMGLVVTGICFLGFCFAFPVLMMQVYNYIKRAKSSVAEYKMLRSEIKIENELSKESAFSVVT